VPGGVESIAPGGGPVYDVSAVQFFQADYLRGYGLSATDTVPDPGRRVTARPMHDDKSANPLTPAQGSVNVSRDGSMAAFVPARRGLSWQLAGTGGSAVVRERYWLSFQAGEIRSCTSCHGVNSLDQTGHGAATNPPLALKTLLDSWKQTHPDSSAGSFQVWSEATLGTTLDPNADNDNDGVTNLVEYATGSGPLSASTPGTASPPLMITRSSVNDQEFVSLAFTRATSQWGVEMSVEFSTDLISWTEAAYYSGSTRRILPEYVQTSVVSGDGLSERIQLTDTSPAAGRRYYRLNILTP